MAGRESSENSTSNVEPITCVIRPTPLPVACPGWELVLGAVVACMGECGGQRSDVGARRAERLRLSNVPSIIPCSKSSTFQRLDAAEHFHDLAGDLALPSAVVHATEVLDHFVGVFGGRFHSDHAGDLLADARVEEAFEEL